MTDKSSLIEEIKNLPFMNEGLELEDRVEDLLGRLKLDEKLDLLSGHTSWSTKPIPRLGIKEMLMTDGPHGIRKESSGGNVCTYFPVGICRTATWNPGLSKEFGKALGKEVRDIGYHIILGPAVNILRTPLNGRNFEYQTEDPFLNARMIVPAVEGIQSMRISACVKHYVANNQETWRHWVDTIVSQRALEEIYFPAFKASVEEADAWSIMCCYNRVNGLFGAEQEDILKGTLMDKWGFRGFVVSDWGAMNFTEGPSGCIKAGLSLEMPSPNRYELSWLKREMDAGNFNEEHVDYNIKRLLRVMFLVGLFDNPSSLPPGSRNTKEHQALARKIAEEGIVLLKNDNNLLPIEVTKVKKIAVIGPNADLKMSEGGGSSAVTPPHDITVIEGIRNFCGKDVEVTDSPDGADFVILVGGLSHKTGESEGGDRQTFDTPPEQSDLINEILEKYLNTVVVLINGTPFGVESWIENATTVLEAWYPGMEGGTAVTNVLFGKVNPSGKLPVTFPKKLEDCSAHASESTYPGIDDEDTGPIVRYDEGIYIGYRHHDAKEIEPRFPFGFGLSYTNFEFKNLEIKPEEMAENQVITVSAELSNTGAIKGAEVVQLYIEPVQPSTDRPPRELKAFEKVTLEAGETKKVSLELDDTSFKYFDENKKSWILEKGTYRVLIGSSSRDIKLQGEIKA
ncbi:MAG: glycoside hydrolase family 3 C-terminal domain-containing protein [Candidatus Hodarchaeota archaeon]